jgi:DNA polymerase III alpha subunit
VESFQSLNFKTYYPKEFMVAVINNFGGFYNTKVYVNEARKAGAIIHLPCVNNSNQLTTIKGDDIYLGFIHIEKLKETLVQTIEKEREQNGLYNSLENFMLRTGASIEQLKILIRIDALRFTQKTKRDLLWEAHLMYNKENNKRKRNTNTLVLFNEPVEEWTFPKFEYNPIEDAYDEFEILGFTTTMSEFSLLKTKSRLPTRAKNLIQYVGQIVRIMGIYVTHKKVRTKRGDMMAFGTFLDEDGDFFDTVNFPPSLQAYPFKGSGVYLIKGKVTQEFDFPIIEANQIEKLAIMPDPRGL